MGRRNARALRVCVDSGVLIEGLLSPWSASRALLILARCGLFRIVLADDVRDEVEENLTDLLGPAPKLADEAIDAYAELLRLLGPERTSPATHEEITTHRHFIRHAADVPILASALRARPDWFVTTNTRHFTRAVSTRTGLRICTPKELLARLNVVG